MPTGQPQLHRVAGRPGTAARPAAWWLRPPSTSARQLLVAGLTAEKNSDKAEHSEAGHDPGGIGQPTKLHHQQARDQWPEAGEKPSRAIAERHRGGADMGWKQLGY